MTKTQKLFITLLALLFIAALVGVGVLIWPNITSTPYPPTLVVIEIPATNTEISYPTAAFTEQTTPTVIIIKKPTGTPYYTITPSPSPVPLPTKVPTSTTAPNPIGFKPAPTLLPKIIIIPTPISVVPAKPDCSGQYNYIESVHQYELNYINSFYDQQLSYYQSMQEQALRERDAQMIIQIVQEINQINANRTSSINTENSRYQADKAYLDAECG